MLKKIISFLVISLNLFSCHTGKQMPLSEQDAIKLAVKHLNESEYASQYLPETAENRNDDDEYYFIWIKHKNWLERKPPAGLIKVHKKNKEAQWVPLY